MNKAFLFYANKYLFIPIIIIIIIKRISNLSFTYPTAINLNNGNIFIIHKTGITICNKYFTKIVKNV